MVSIPALIQTEQRRWNAVAIQDNKKSAFQGVALRLVKPAAKAVYLRIEARTKVPWYVVAVIHEREASQNFARQLGQGDPLNQVSTHVPKGWGPYLGASAFEDAAYDALTKAAPKAAMWTDWSVGGTLTILEEYNGLGYAGKGLPSPYVWAGTNQYVSGKYTSDGHFDPNAVDSQLGVAGLLVAMAQVDPSIKLGTSAPLTTTTVVARVSSSKPVVAVVPAIHDAPSIVPSQGPSITNPAAGSIGDAVVKIFSSLFSHLHH